MKTSLRALIKSGVCKVQGKCLRCTNKGITSITNIPEAEKIQQIFMSSNLISSLAGIQYFKNLKVLSLSFNEIQKISDLKYLKGIQLQTLNLEGNPITHLPYYQHNVVASIDSLLLFDGKSITDQLREKAKTTVEYERSRLRLLCLNEYKIKELENIMNMNQMTNESILNFQRISELTADSFEDDDEQFDNMRSVAVDIRNENKNCKWSDIYDQIESVQQKAISNLTSQISTRIPHQTYENDNNQTFDTFEHENEELTNFLHWNDIRILSKYFHLWRNLPKSRNQLQLQFISSFDFPLKETESTNHLLLEEAQSMTLRISSLEYSLDESEKKCHEITELLNESIRNESKMKRVIRHLNNQKKSLKQQLYESEQRYEKDVIQFMLEKKFENSDIYEENKRLSEQIKQNEIEKDALKRYIEEIKKQSNTTINDLRKKLDSAFDITNELRKEVARLRNLSEMKKIKYVRRCSSSSSESSSSPILDDDEFGTNEKASHEIVVGNSPFKTKEKSVIQFMK